MPDPILDEVLEALVRRATEADGGVDLGCAREAFHERAGAFEAGEPGYEPRIQFFLDWYLCTWVSPDGSRPAARAARSADEQAIAGACANSERCLMRVLEVDGALVRVTDPLGGARFRITQTPGPGPERLRPDDVFDGHLIVLDERILLMPGPIFHPPEAHEPLAAILARARDHETLDGSASDAADARTELLDALLRMQLRLERFTSMRARHIYRWEALGERDILSAGWARKNATG
jgi:hypothetical protein